MRKVGKLDQLPGREEFTVLVFEEEVVTREYAERYLRHYIPENHDDLELKILEADFNGVACRLFKMVPLGINIVQKVEVVDG